MFYIYIYYNTIDLIIIMSETESKWLGCHLGLKRSGSGVEGPEQPRDN